MTPAQLRASLSTLGLSQARAAALLGVTTDAVSKWANGKRAIPGPVARLVWLALQRGHFVDNLEPLENYHPLPK